MTDLSALNDLSPEERAAVIELGKNQGTTDPAQLPGRPQVWKVGGRWFLAIFIPGTQTPMVWEATQEELAEKFGGIDNPAAPPPDRTLTDAEFKQLSPWRAGRINEIRNTSDDPWTQFFSDFNEAADLRPWLRDPDMLAVIAVANLEGRDPTTDELSQTDWWQNHTADERKWLEESVTLGADEIGRRQGDMRREVTSTMLQLGLKNVNPKIIDHIANKRVTGVWSESYTMEQITKLADPYAPGELNKVLADLVNSGMRQSRVEEDTVRGLVSRWLGPTMGTWNQNEVERWAGRLRNNPDAQVELEEMLRQQRMAMFPNYTNPNLTYEDIITPFRNLASNVWGRAVKDETMLVDLANLGDFAEAQKRLRKTGLDQGITKVVQDALGELGSTAMGERVVRSAI